MAADARTVGFDDTGLTKKTYAVDLSGYWQHCPAQGDLPVDSWSFATGMTLSTGQPLVCGGYNFYLCYAYNFQGKSWDHVANFPQGMGARGVPQPDGTTWVVGGKYAKRKSQAINTHVQISHFGSRIVNSKRTNNNRNNKHPKRT